LNTQGQPVTPTTPVATPTTRDYSRYDLNGDGFTGGFTLAVFDLDRVGSTQFGAPRITADVTQDIQGLELRFDETILTDLAILCYYAYSDLFQGNDADRALRAELLGLARCTRLELEAAFTGSVEPNTNTPLTIRAVRRSPVTLQLVPTSGIHLSLVPTGGTVQDASGITGGNGTFQTTAQLAAGSPQISILIEARAAPGGSVLATTTVQTAAPNGLTLIAATAKAGANPATFPNDSCLPDTTPPPLTVLQSNVSLPATLSAMCLLGFPGEDVTARISGTLNSSGNSFTVRGVTLKTDGNSPFVEIDILVGMSGATGATVTLAGEPAIRSWNRINLDPFVSIFVAPSGAGGSGGVSCRTQGRGTAQTPPPWTCQEEPIQLLPNAAVRIGVFASPGDWDVTLPDITVTFTSS
jgi:hypothetical protein